MIIFSCKSKTLNSPCLAEKVIWRRNIHMSLCVCVHVWDPHEKICKILFDSTLPRTAATDVTTMVLNKPQTVFPTITQLPFLVPPEMWYFSSEGMILRISQGMLRGNGRCYNKNHQISDLILGLFRAMIRSHLLSDFFAYHQGRKSFPCYSLTKENILLSHFWTRMMLVHSILNLVLSIKVCGNVQQAWKSS